MQSEMKEMKVRSNWSDITLRYIPSLLEIYVGEKFAGNLDLLKFLLTPARTQKVHTIRIFSK